MLLSLLLLGLGALAIAYEVPVSDVDLQRQVCSGMWGGQKAHINGSFVSSLIQTSRQNNAHIIQLHLRMTH